MRGFGTGLLTGAAIALAVATGVAMRQGGRFVAVRVRRGPPRLQMRRGTVEVAIPRLKR